MAKTGIRLLLLCVSAIFTIALTGCNNGYPPLHNAVSWGDKKAVERLLSQGADVNAKATIIISNAKSPRFKFILLKPRYRRGFDEKYNASKNPGTINRPMP